MPRAFFIDTSRCIACRGCQVACKEWHGLPAVATKQRGTHQNPPDLNPFNYKLVRFREEKINGKIEWLFFPDQCHHCLDPTCKGIADSFAPGAVVVDDKTGAVIYTDKISDLTAGECREIQKSCPYDIPRRDDKTGRLTKCDMCIDRLEANLSPVCVKTCSTGAMNFGERAEILDIARLRLESVKKSHPGARLMDPEDVGVIYLVTYPDKAVSKPEKHAGGRLSRRDLLANLVSPLLHIAD